MKTICYKIFLFALFPILALLCSCKEKNSGEKSTNATISYFAVKHTRLPIDSSTVFTIDANSGLIYNYDSLPYQSPKDSFVPTIFGRLLSKVLINDSIEYSGKDTIDFSNLVKLQSWAEDKKTTKNYVVELRIHTVDPDLYIWKQIKNNIYTETPVEEKAFYHNGQLCLFVKTASDITLYSSTDGKTWLPAAVTGLPTTASLQKTIKTTDGFCVADNGLLHQSTNGQQWTNTAINAPVSYLLFEMNKKIFALGTDNAIYTTADKTQWTNIGNAPTNFPENGAAISVDYSPNGKARAYVAGGETAGGDYLNSVWSTENGSHWVNLTDSTNYFSARTGASIIQYDGMLMLFGGKDKDGLVKDPHWISSNYGMIWTLPTAKITLPEGFQRRCGQSVVVDDTSRIYIIGGYTFGGFLKDVWTGKKNRFSFLIR
ncbi:MAG: hypothetical protein KBB61_01665 [Paludibacteraceae bacterium]|jgi:hypothetical protein|nr:hypothetical protein [Paludibacteraceae bacterium]MDI9536409.1 DUF6242 domain-containing protein [Bacteroidota bacterium]HHT61486.1 hypothetical protein [Bacteroidales bacterium]MBP9038811.1 hypothetical protein [Paludibacteraceae bacterium]HOA46008.1 DUF6242 domain-containing protein [Paludibacteraceae bacterium]